MIARTAGADFRRLRNRDRRRPTRRTYVELLKAVRRAMAQALSLRGPAYPAGLGCPFPTRRGVERPKCDWKSPCIMTRGCTNRSDAAGEPRRPPLATPGCGSASRVSVESRAVAPRVRQFGSVAPISGFAGRLSLRTLREARQLQTDDKRSPAAVAEPRLASHPQSAQSRSARPCVPSATRGPVRLRPSHRSHARDGPKAGMRSSHDPVLRRDVKATAGRAPHSTHKPRVGSSRVTPRILSPAASAQSVDHHPSCQPIRVSLPHNPTGAPISL
jgi:hypothetical protein